MQFSPRIGINGISFKFSDVTASTPCTDSSDYLFQASLIIRSRQGIKSTNDYISRCKDTFSEELSFILEIPQRANTEGITNYISQKVTSKSKRFKLISHLNQISKVREIQNRFLSLSQSLIGSSKEILIKETRRNQFLKEIKSLPESPWKDVLLLNLSSFSDNIFWTQKILQNLNTYGPYVPLFHGLDKVDLNDNKLANFFSVTIERAQKKLKNDDHKFFVSRLVDYSGRKLVYKELENRFSALWSLNELREQYQDPYIKFNYFDFLLEKMLQRASENEIKEYLRQTIKKELISNMRSKQMWTLQLFYPKDQKLRNSILNKMGEIWLEGSFLEKYQVLVNLENKTIKMGLSKRFPGLERALYKIEKDFYTELLYSGQGTLFAFSELYRLGDYRSEYLWLLAF